MTMTGTIISGLSRRSERERERLPPPYVAGPAAKREKDRAVSRNVPAVPIGSTFRPRS